MHYDFLYEFTIVAEEQSFTKAARRLSVSQPALGRHMDTLEASLGVQLLVRTPKGITLTPEGRWLQNQALNIVSIGEIIEDHFVNRRAERGRRTLYVGGSVTSKTVRQRLEQARNAAEARPFDIRYLDDESFASIAEALDNSLADITLAFRANIDAENLWGHFACTKIVDSPLDAVVEQSHPLASRTSICLDELEGHTVGHLFGRKRNATSEWAEFKRLCDLHGFCPESRNMGWEVSPGWGTWSIPDAVLVFPRDLRDTEALEAFGKARIPIEDATFELYAITRSDDAFARSVVAEGLDSLHAATNCHEESKSGD